MSELLPWQRRLRYILIAPGHAWGLGTRLVAHMYAKRLLPAWTPPAPSVGVGAISVGAWGECLVSAWMLGWAEARGLKPALLAAPQWGSPPQPAFKVDASTRPEASGPQAALLARYRPACAVYADANPVRAGKAAAKAHSPGFFVLHGHFSALNARRQADIVVLTPQDLDKGWNRPLPAGLWREPANALNRASAFVLCIWPDETPLRAKLAERRLARFGKPVFTVHPSIWRLRRPADGQTATSLGGEPYLLVAGESGQDMAAKAAQAFLGQPPRLRIIFPDSHRFTPYDAAQIAQDATRLRTPHVLATPEAALGIASIPGRTFWTYDPDVVLGPCLLGGGPFTPWWDKIAAPLLPSP